MTGEGGGVDPAIRLRVTVDTSEIDELLARLDGLYIPQHMALVLRTEGAATFRELAAQEARRLLARELAAALADPGVHPHGKSLAGYLLDRLKGMEGPDIFAQTYDPVYQEDVTKTEPLGWHVISGVHLLETLHRCYQGEHPDLVFAELWANAKHEQVEGE